MAKKTKKTKITETIVNQLQETPSIVEEEKEIKEEKVVNEKKPIPQESKLFDKLVESKIDSETAGINFGISGIL